MRPGPTSRQQAKVSHLESWPYFSPCKYISIETHFARTNTHVSAALQSNFKVEDLVINLRWIGVTDPQMDHHTNVFLQKNSVCSVAQTNTGSIICIQE